MSRSGYSDDCEGNRLGLWRQSVANALNGWRGQEFLKEMLEALDAMPERKLIAYDLEKQGEVCAIGAVGQARGIDMAELDSEDRDSVGAAFRIAPAMAAEIVYMNDEYNWKPETPEERWQRMRTWVSDKIKAPPA